MSTKLRILLADDHHLIREGIRSLVDAQTDMQVVAEAADGDEAWQISAEIIPDVAVLDLSMPKLGGADACARILRDRPSVRVLALTVHEDRSYLQQLFQAGALGYVLKRAAAADLLDAIRTVATGEKYVDPRLAHKVAGVRLGSSAPPPLPTGEPLLPEEEQALRLLANGASNREVAATLHMPLETLVATKMRAMDRLGLQSRAELVAYAVRHGWLQPT